MDLESLQNYYKLNFIRGFVKATNKKIKNTIFLHEYDLDFLNKEDAKTIGILLETALDVYQYLGQSIYYEPYFGVPISESCYRKIENIIEQKSYPCSNCLKGYIDSIFVKYYNKNCVLTEICLFDTGDGQYYMFGSLARVLRI